MVDHTLRDVPLANSCMNSLYYRGHCRVMCVGPPVYPLIIGNVLWARRMWLDFEDQGGDMTCCLFKERCNLEKTKKCAPKKKNSTKKSAKLWKNNISARRDVKVKGGATQEECVAIPVVTKAQAKKSDRINPLKVKEALSSVYKFTIEDEIQD